MADIKSQLPIRITDGTNTVAVETDALKIVGTVETAGIAEVDTGVISSYATVATVDPDATGDITYTVTSGYTFFWKSAIASSSDGPCRVDVINNASTVAVGFYAASSPIIQFNFPQPLPVLSTTVATVKITNKSSNTQDLYGSIFGREIAD